MDEKLLELLRAGASELDVALDDAAVGRFSTYLSLLQAWGRKINLTTRLEAKEIVIYHFLDSLAGVRLISRSPGSQVVDLGSGAGLPALPLKFALSGLRLTLIESVRKKVAFCQEVIRATGISDTVAAWGRGEDLCARDEHRQAYDLAVSRALGPSAEVAALAFPFLAPGGRVLLYKGEPELEELRALDIFCADKKADWKLHPVAVPHLHAARSLVVVTFP